MSWAEDSCLAHLPWDYLLHDHIDPAHDPTILDWQYDFLSNTRYNSLRNFLIRFRNPSPCN